MTSATKIIRQAKGHYERYEDARAFTPRDGGRVVGVRERNYRRGETRFAAIVEYEIPLQYNPANKGAK